MQCKGEYDRMLVVQMAVSVSFPSFLPQHQLHRRRKASDVASASALVAVAVADTVPFPSTPPPTNPPFSCGHSTPVSFFVRA